MDFQTTRGARRGLMAPAMTRAGRFSATHAKPWLDFPRCRACVVPCNQRYAHDLHQICKLAIRCGANLGGHRRNHRLVPATLPSDARRTQSSRIIELPNGCSLAGCRLVEVDGQGGEAEP